MGSEPAPNTSARIVADIKRNPQVTDLIKRADQAFNDYVEKAIACESRVENLLADRGIENGAYIIDAANAIYKIKAVRVTLAIEEDAETDLNFEIEARRVLAVTADHRVELGRYQAFHSDSVWRPADRSDLSRLPQSKRVSR